ncbi:MULTISPECIES: GIY-YIG nuclease family protein [Brevundimonas]|uniref:GIY-YIG nuclease family protein n=1 Tax=Brevundimonas sp. UBA7507 TaxID=1946137 RepID=UPI00257C87B4|nr:MULTISPECIES: GIY-YIG nuclease family protein [Brevundimonas]
MPSPYTLRIFVAEGDPEGLRVVERVGWTGRGLVIPRDRWSEVKGRPELDRAGVYILVVEETDEIGQDRSVLYIGQTEALRWRVDNHEAKKDFWSRVILFVSNSNSLNRAHVTWLEWALINRIKGNDGVVLANGNVPNEPNLDEFEKADTTAFLDDLLSILPLVGLRAFEPKKVIKPAPVPTLLAKGTSDIDTIVVPAQPEGFATAYLGEHAWWAIRIAQSKLDKLKWCAAYQVSPISQITHIAEIDRIEPYGDSGKYKLFFKGSPVALEHPVPYGAAPSGVMQAPRYTTRQKVMSAKSVMDINL